MDEKIIGTLLVIVGLIGYELLWGIATIIWQRWAEKKAGQFWDYSLKEGKRLYFPGLMDFERNHRIVYKVVKPVVWPVAMATNTKVLTRIMDMQHYY